MSTQSLVIQQENTWGLVFALPLTKSSKSPRCRGSTLPLAVTSLKYLGLLAAWAPLPRRETLGLKCGIERVRGRFRADLLAELTEVVQDPNIEVDSSLRGNTLVGVHGPIVPSVDFPAASVNESRLGFLQHFYQIHAKGEFTTASFTSFEEHAEDARVELQRVVDLKAAGIWEDVVNHWPDALLVRIAVLVGLKSDCAKKVRFILNALRNGTRGRSRSKNASFFSRAHECGCYPSPSGVLGTCMSQLMRAGLGVGRMFLPGTPTLEKTQQSTRLLVCGFFRGGSWGRGKSFSRGTYGGASLFFFSMVCSFSSPSKVMMLLTGMMMMMIRGHSGESCSAMRSPLQTGSV